MNVALTRDLVALEVEKEEVIRGIGFTEGYARALDPETTTFRIAQREMAESHIGMALRVEDAAGFGKFDELFWHYVLFLGNQRLTLTGFRYK
jgi:hypothetical protein